MKQVKLIYQFLSFLTALMLFATSAGITVCAAEPDREAEREEHKALPIQTDAIQNWPKGPAIGARSAILMEMNTHTILYAKNIHERNYPASTTKILTCLLAMQNCTIDEIVTF